MKGHDAIVLALLIVAVAAVLAWMQRGVNRFAAMRRAASDDQFREGAEQSGLFPTYGEDDQ